MPPKRILRSSAKCTKTELVSLDASDESNCSKVSFDSYSEDSDSSPDRKKVKTNQTKKTTSNKTSMKRIKHESFDEFFPDKKKTKKTASNKTSIKKIKHESINEFSPDRNKTKTTTSNKRTIKKIEETEAVDNTIETKKLLNIKKCKYGWSDSDLLSEKENLHIQVAHSVIKLFEAGNTIPFIARYRRHLTDDMSPEKLRYVKDSYEEICTLKNKSQNVLKLIEKTGNLSAHLKDSILNCKSMQELEHIYAPYKQGSKKTLAERAKSLGLEEASLALLTGSKDVNPASFVNENGKEGIRTIEEVKNSFIHLIAHFISNDTDVLEFLRNLKKNANLKIETKQSTSAKKTENIENISKFEQYFNYQNYVNNIKPHQILAINRGEHLKILSVKILIPDFVFKKLKNFCENKWLNMPTKNGTRIYIFESAITDAYKRLISPLISRNTRSSLNMEAEKASIEVFAINLKKRLLEKPLKGQPILGIDPGFNVGCKIAIISKFGDVLDTGVINPHIKKIKQGNDENYIYHLLKKHNCTLIALGNGTACRETETWLTELIKSKFFHPLDVSYTIVDESGASVYSCSDEAKKEFVNLDALVVSAISLARRIQNPLAELIKVDPKSLGVGMYQHDLNKKALENTLNEVVSECVSFVGVDLNTASHCILRKVAGLTAQRAENILKQRTEKGPFTNRFQLKDVKGIGEKVFEQCAGFLRIGPANSEQAKEFYERPDTMPLDCTWIHPESYELAEKIIFKFNLHYKNIGQIQFIEAIKLAISKTSIQNLAEEFKASETTVKLIIEVLSRPLDHDLREESSQQPLFRKGITSMSDIQVGIILTGRVMNVTHFGAFVDIGVGKNGLIHNSRMKRMNVELGQRVEVEVISFEKDKVRIGLQLMQIM